MKELRIATLSVICALSFSISASAGIDFPPAVPIDAVAVEALPLPAPKKQEPSFVKKQQAGDEVMPNIPKGGGVVVLELFSTQACSFCPKADRLMKDLVQRDDLIALSCHVDYFDVELGSLALPICSTRQAEYEESLSIGPKYTPQMVMNGHLDAIGYFAQEIQKSIEAARNDVIFPLSITPMGNEKYALYLPYLSEGEYKIWLLVYQNPIDHTIKSGANIGKMMTYYNLVSSAGFLGNWDGRAKAFSFYPKMGKDDKGFAVLVQDEQSKHMMAAAKFEK